MLLNNPFLKNIDPVGFVFIAVGIFKSLLVKGLLFQTSPT
ncbi:hypothetical protein [Klebsiella pneumoniae IS10]|nr:hypothetical protein [Klebsiella pneumoniae IS10]